MALPPQKFREIVFQILFSKDFGAEEPQEMVALLMKELKVTKKVMLDAYTRMEAVFQNIEEIDQKISSHSPDYVFERISRTERSILRLGTFELLFDPSIPPKVAIAEAIRICRKFGSPQSAQFVNAVLDSVFTHVKAAAGALA